MYVPFSNANSGVKKENVGIIICLLRGLVLKLKKNYSRFLRVESFFIYSEFLHTSKSYFLFSDVFL